MKDYYQTAGEQAISIIRKTLTREEYDGFLKGNILKYRLRAGKKTSDPRDDIKKADDYENLLTQTNSEHHDK